jgi:hypothetical protein
MIRRLWGVLILTLTISTALPAPASAVTTNYRGETVDWEVTYDGAPLEVSLWYCEDYYPPFKLSFWGKCHYRAKWPPVGSELHATATITPVYLEVPENVVLPPYVDGSALDVCFPNYYGDCIRSENCSPLSAEDWTLFYPKDLAKDHVEMVFRRNLHSLLPGGGAAERVLYIDLWLFNTELFSIQSLPWLEGGPRDNRHTRYRPRQGEGPGK